MKQLNTTNILSWLLAAFFIVGGGTNIFPPAAIVENYARWGYPDCFHYVTGILELGTAVLLLLPSKRLAGCLLGSAVMLAAGGTVVLHGEYSHAIGPLLVLAALLLNIWLLRRSATKTFPA